MVAEPVLATSEDLRTIYTLAAIALYLTLAGFLALARPSSPASRILAAVFALLAVRQLTFLGLPVPGAAAAAARQDLVILGGFAWLGFLALYPSKVRLRSWQGAVLLALLAQMLVVAASWVLDRGTFASSIGVYILRDPESGLGLTMGLALATGFARARALEGGERRGAALVLAGGGLAVFPNLGDGPARLVLLALGEPDVGPDPDILANASVAFFHIAALAVVGALALLLAWRWRAYAPLLLAAWGAALIFALGAVDGPAGGFTQFQTAPAALAVLYGIARHGAFGARPRRRSAEVGVAAAVFLAFFLMANIFVLTYSQSPFMLMLAMLGGLAAGGLGAASVLNPGGLRIGALGADRLGPYRAALAAEVSAGAGPEETSRKLQGLRRELGVTDTEHALMDYTIRAGGGGAAVSLDAGQLFAGRYRVRRGLGRGGEGPAYLCRDERAGRDVVVKVLRPGPGTQGMAAVLREARSLAAVRHPRVVTLYDVEAVGDQAFLVMEHAEGGSLAARLERGALPPQEWRALARDLLEGLEAAHAAGVVHRDVKPSNLLFGRDQRVMLGDFGVARLPGAETTVGWAGADEGAVGTVRYMSPEQARGRPTGPASDLYSAAAVLYEAWTGRPYVQRHGGESVAEVQMRVASAAGFDQPFQGPAGVRAWFRKALHPEPEQRFAGARAMRDALDDALRG